MSADDSAKDENVAAIEGQDSVVEDVPGDASGPSRRFRAGAFPGLIVVASK